MALEIDSGPLSIFFTVVQTFKVCLIHSFFILILLTDFVSINGSADKGIPPTESRSIWGYIASWSFPIHATIAFIWAAQ